jgi:hypothetical protein
MWRGKRALLFTHGLRPPPPHNGIRHIRMDRRQGPPHRGLDLPDDAHVRIADRNLDGAGGGQRGGDDGAAAAITTGANAGISSPLPDNRAVGPSAAAPGPKQRRFDQPASLRRLLEQRWACGSSTKCRIGCLAKDREAPLAFSESRRASENTSAPVIPSRAPSLRCVIARRVPMVGSSHNQNHA